MVAEAVYEKMWKGGVLSESEGSQVYLDVHDAVLAAVELDTQLHQQVPLCDIVQ